MMSKYLKQRVGLFCIAVISGCAALSIQKASAEELPTGKMNLLLIMDDQHRGDCVGAEGADWIHTPNLDKLAKDGVLFTRGYVSVPSCLPARAAILTGKSTWAHGMLTYTDIPETYSDEMPTMLNNAGYYTIAVGKNHFNGHGYKAQLKRISHGYQEMHVEEAWRSTVPKVDPGNCDYANWFYKNAPGKDLNATGLGYTDHRGATPFAHDEKFHPTNWTSARAVHFLKSKKSDKPWMMKVSFQRPHPPFDPPKRWLDFYQGKRIPKAEVGQWAEERYKNVKPRSINVRPSAPNGKYTEEEIRESRRAYYAAISHVDENVGKVIQALKEKGQLENTIIIFTADHGDQMGDQHMWRKCRAYDASARVPFIVRWPESMEVTAKRGSQSSKLVELRDILPTFLATAGVSQPADMDGMNILDALNGKKWREVLDLEHGGVYEKDNGWTALTDGRYKYVYYTNTGDHQLFDLKNDPHEKVNLATQPAHAALTKTWRKRMIKHLSVRGPRWVKDGDLTIQKRSIGWRPGYPKAIR